MRLFLTVLASAMAVSVACNDPQSHDADLTITGVIRDSATLERIPNATVVFYKAQGFSRANALMDVRTNDSGYYSIRLYVKDCFNSLIALSVSASGYGTRLMGYIDEPPWPRPYCTESPQTVNASLIRDP
jgi:hypothetical protein